MRPTSDGAFDKTMPFIDLIVCPSYEVAYNHSQLQRYGLTRSLYRSKGKFYPIKDSTQKTELRDVFDTVSHGVADILSEVRFSTLNIDQHTFVENIDHLSNDSDPSNINIITSYFDSFGKCYSIRPKPNVLKQGIIGIDILARMDISIYMGHPGQFMYNTKSRVNFVA